jgi:uncharacterized membrane protein YeaQ/YmgE (transglycosylase-associated protein family)
MAFDEGAVAEDSLQYVLQCSVSYNPLHMTLFDLLILLIVAGICGALGQAITGFSRGGCLVSIALGFVGAILGLWIARALGLPELFPVRIGTTNFPIVWSIIGSALFVAVIAFLTRRRL